MIGFNGQYLSAAAIGDMRITAMSQGDKWLLGGSPFSDEATAAIKAVFSSSDWYIIVTWAKTADAYLIEVINQFAPEDPYIMYSLVSELSKKRWLVGDGKAWIDTEVVPTLTTEVETTIKYDEPLSGSVYFWGVGTGGAETCFRQQSDKFLGFRAWYSAAFTAPITAEQGRGYDIVVHSHSGEQYIVIDGVKYAVGTATSANNSVTCLLYTMNYNGPYTSGMKKCSFGKFKITTESATQHLLPFIRNGECGMIDILTGTFHPNANTEGAFTIAITDKA